MSGPVIYVAGPFRGPDAFAIAENVRAAERAALDVARHGATPLCPHTMYAHFQGALPDAFWLDATLGLLGRCDALLLIRGWESSAGSRGELAEARRLGLVVAEVGDVEPTHVAVRRILVALDERSTPSDRSGT